MVFGSSISSSRKKKRKKNYKKTLLKLDSWTPYDKTFRIRACICTHSPPTRNQSYLQCRPGVIRAISPFDSNVYHSQSLQQAPPSSITATEFVIHVHLNRGTSLYLTPYSLKKRRRKERRRTQNSRSKYLLTYCAILLYTL